MEIFNSKLQPWLAVLFWLTALFGVIFLLQLLKLLVRGGIERLTAGGTRERTGGFILFVAGAMLSYFCFDAVQSARNGAPKVSVSLAAALIAPLGVIGGLLLLVLGPRARTLLGTREEPTTAGWIIGIAALALGVILYLWLRQILEAEGYDLRDRR